MFGRRHFTRRALALTGAALLPRQVRAAEDFDPLRDLVGVLIPGVVRPVLTLDALGDITPMATRFHRWMFDLGFARDRSVRNLVFNFYDTSKRSGTWIYPMLAGKAIIWMLGRGRVADAKVVAEALLRWQQTCPH